LAIPIVRPQSLRIPDTTSEKRIAGALRSGCFSIQLDVNSSDLSAETQLAGVVRVERVKESATKLSIRLSGDLYALTGSLNVGSQLRVFPRNHHRLYITLADSETEGDETVRFQSSKLKMTFRSVRLDGLDWTNGPRLTMLLSGPDQASQSNDFSVELRRVSVPARK